MIRNKQRRHLEPPRLNLTAMVDVFTVLLVFLLKSYTAEGTLPSPVPVNLPFSTANATADIQLVITVTGKDLYLEKTPIEDPDLMNPDTLLIPKLNEELRSELKAKTDLPAEKKVTILGDKKIPFFLLKKVIYTCTQNGLSDISLAVYQKGENR